MIRVEFEVFTKDIDLMPCVCDIGSDLLDQLFDNMDKFEDGLKIPFPDPNYKEMMKSMGTTLKSQIHEEFKIYGDDRVKGGVYSDNPIIHFIEYGTGLYGEGPGHIKKEIVAKEVGNKKPFFFWVDENGIHIMAKHSGMHPIPIFRSSLLKLRFDAKRIIYSYVEKYKMTTDIYKLNFELI